MSLLEKLRNLPEGKRKIILEIVVVLVAVLFSIFYIKSLKLRLESLKSEEIRERLKISEFQEKLKELPKIEMPKIELPEIPEEELKKISEEENKIFEKILKEGQE